MGTFQNLVSALCFVCVLFVIFTYGNDIDNERIKGPDVRKDHSLKTGHRADGSIGSDCPCKESCMIGNYCNESVEMNVPVFNQRTTKVVLTEQQLTHNVPLPYNSTTYHHDRLCPCDLFVYIIKKADNGKGENREDVFSINKHTGEIHLNMDVVRASEFDYEYHLEVEVQNMKTKSSDSTILIVARSMPSVADDMFKFEQEEQNDFQPFESHNRYKRSAVPADVTFNFSMTNDAVEPVGIGKQLHYLLEIIIPYNVDMQVELFAPDSTTNVMILCGVEVTQIGTDLVTGISNGTDSVVLAAKPGYDNNTNADWAIINMDTVTTTATSAETSTISVAFTAVRPDTNVVETEYCVSAGAIYQAETFIWVGQHCFQVDNNDTVNAEEPIMNATMPASVAIGSSHIVDIELYIPYPVREYVFKIFPPADTVGLMSVCGIWLKGVGDNFGCGNDLNLVNDSVVKNPQGQGYAIGILELGKLLNKASGDIGPVDVTQNLVHIEAIVHLYADTGLSYVGQTISMGLALEIDSTTVLIGNVDFVVDAEVTTGLTDLIVSGIPNTTLSTNWDDAVIGEPFEVSYTLEVPLPATPDVASEYVLEMLMPMDGSIPEFSVCQLTVVSVGKGLSCIILEDLETVYSSRSGGLYSEADGARLSLGHVINLGHYNDAGDNEITVKVVLMPLAHSNNVNIGSSHNISFVAIVGTQSLTLVSSTVQIGNERTSTQITNTTHPGFTIGFADGSANPVNVRASTKVAVDVTVNPGLTYLEWELQHIMPKLTDNYAYFHICKVEIESAGRNVPCMTPDWYNEQVKYSSSFNNYLVDQALLPLGSVCNFQNVVDPAEDKARIIAYVHILDRPELLDGHSEDVNVALVYSNDSLVIGTHSLTINRGGSFSPAGVSFVSSSEYTPGSTPRGLTKEYKLLIKIPTGSTTDLTVVATAADSNLKICSVRVVKAGSNLPCVSDELATRTYGDLTVEFSMGIVTNYGDSSNPMTANSQFDDNTIEAAVVVQATPGAVLSSHSFDVQTYFDTAKSNSVTSSFSVSVTDDGSVPQVVGEPITCSSFVGEITGEDNTTDIAPGESKKVLISLVIPENTNYRVRVKVTIPTADVDKLEICQASVESVGDNLPCIVPLLDHPIYSTTSGHYNDEADFDLGYTCNTPLRPGDVEANTVVLAVYVRLVPNGIASIGNPVTVTTTVSVFNTTTCTKSLPFVVQDPATFTDRRLVMNGVSNETLVSLSPAGAVVMGIGETQTFQANLSIVRNSVSRLLFDLETPVTDSACLTVSEVRVIGSVGKNVLCVEGDDNNKGVTYDYQYESTQNSSQMNYVFVDLGIVTNTGYTYKQDVYEIGDDDVSVEFDIVMADCAGSVNGTIHEVSVGKKISDFVLIHDFDVTTLRSGDEKPDFDHVMVVDASLSTATVIHMNGTLQHTVNSTAEGMNTSIFIFLPYYQKAPAVIYTNNSDCNNIYNASKPSLVEIRCNHFFFTDVLEYSFEIQLDDGVSLPPGFSSDPSYAFSMVGTNFNVWSPTYNETDWYPYYVDEFQNISYPLTVPTTSVGCGTTIGVEDSAIVLDCQFQCSVQNWSSSNDCGARYGATQAWSPFIRGKSYAKLRYASLYFGHLHQFTSILLKNVVGYSDKCTEFIIDYTNDGSSYFSPETVTLGSNPNTEETMSLSGVEARGIRLTITNDTSNGDKSQVGLQFKLFGCKLADPDGISNTDACSVVDVTANAPAEFYRGFLGLSTDLAYFCDRDVTKYREKPKGQCYGTHDGGSTWSKIDGRVGSLSGYSPSDNYVFAYINGRNAMAVINPVTDEVTTVTQAKFDDAKLEADWINAVAVPEIDDISLNLLMPTAEYTQGDWGANYMGVFKGGLRKVDWT